jgi:hypothetical protein
MATEPVSRQSELPTLVSAVGVGCEEPRACKWLMVFRAKADVMNRIQWPSLPSQGVPGGREKDV